MKHDAARLNIDELDLKHVAMILNRVYPHYSLCDCARLVAEFVPEEGCVCSICEAGTYPDCVRNLKAHNPSTTTHHRRA